MCSRIVSVLGFVLASSWLLAIDASKLGLRHHRIDDERLGPVDLYVVDTLLDRALPVLLFLDGSGPGALFSMRIGPDGKPATYSSIPFAYKQMGARYHLAFVAKPGAGLVDTVPAGGAPRPVPPDYSARLSAAWRAQAASMAVDWLLSTFPCDRRHVGVMGFSEGAQVAPRVAVLNRSVTHVMAFVGSGLNQFYEMIIQQRMAADRGEVTHAEAQAAIDSLFATYAGIYANPTSTQDEWYGHSHLRWSSFTSPPTIDYLTQLDIPIYLAHGTMDRNTNVLSTDYVRLEFLRLGKKNLTHVNYPGCDHSFNCWDDGRMDGPPQHRRLREVLEAGLAWFDAH